MGIEEREGWPDGRENWVSTTKVPLHAATGEVVGLLGISRDITAKKLAEQALERTTQDLSRSNTELQHFAYVASHDLQEPLRMVSSYVQLLARRYKGKLDQEADEFIQYAVDGASRMKRLINDLLTYSRVGTHGKELTPVSAETALAIARQHLQMSLEDSKAQLVCDPLPTVWGDEMQLVELFQNLLGNALKFRRPETPPCLRVSVVREGAQWRFAVKDNGIGFDTKYGERIFGMFQRLHSVAEYEGTGIGLALCRRIVERHRGRMWAESSPGEGATFYFTLDAAGG